MLSVVSKTDERKDGRWSFSPTSVDIANRKRIEAHFKAMDIEFTSAEFIAKMVRSGMKRQIERIEGRKHDRR